MDLNRYMESRNITTKEMAKMLNISPSTLNNYLAGRRVPTLEVAVKIEEITRGNVRPKDLMTFFWELDRLDEDKFLVMRNGVDYRE